ncbi:MAG: hypothetical protein KBD66_00355 [Candidatus Doudnabacteria bacterium]|nr:hypothetical protein [Candidatus Doudnabacteria bacterium]
MLPHFPQALLDDTPEADILSFLLFAPPRTFSARELGVRLNMRPNKLVDSLARLVETGQLSPCSRGSIRYYRLNPKHKFYPEVHEVLLKRAKQYEDELYIAIKKLGVKAAYLSGLFVGKPELEVDMLLVGDIKSQRLQTFVEACEHMMGQEVNYCVMSEEEFVTRKDTFDRFIKDIFDYPYLTVQALSIPRVK